MIVLVIAGTKQEYEDYKQAYRLQTTKQVVEFIEITYRDQLPRYHGAGYEIALVGSWEARPNSAMLKARADRLIRQGAKVL